MVFGNIVEPNLMGRRLGLSTLVVILSLLFWAWVWGPVGALLAVPLTMVVKIMLENTEDLRWVAILLDKTPPQLGANAAVRFPSQALPADGDGEGADGVELTEWASHGVKTDVGGGGGGAGAPARHLRGLHFLRGRKAALIDGAGDDARDLSAHLASYLDGGVSTA